MIEFKLGESEINEGAGHLCKIENLIKEYNAGKSGAHIRLPDLKIIITGTRYGYRRDAAVFVIPTGSLKD